MDRPAKGRVRDVSAFTLSARPGFGERAQNYKSGGQEFEISSGAPQPQCFFIRVGSSVNLPCRMKKSAWLRANSLQFGEYLPLFQILQNPTLATNAPIDLGSPLAAFASHPDASAVPCSWPMSILMVVLVSASMSRSSFCVASIGPLYCIQADGVPSQMSAKSR